MTEIRLPGIRVRRIEVRAVTEQEYQRLKEAVGRAVEGDVADRTQVLRECLRDEPLLLATAEQWLAAYDGSPIKDWLATQGRATTVGRTHGAGAVPALNGTTAPTHVGQPMMWGDFILLEELGRGGFGVVYRAHERALKREVALKVIDPSAKRAHRESIRLEGQMLARVEHPNVVKVYGIHPHGEQLAIAMEYVRGHTLAEIVASDGPFTPRDAVATAATICDALMAVHRGGLLHRDIKASNVMRAADGRIVLMDFGAGRDRYRPHEPGSDIVGTPIYMAPEIFAGAVATPASDVFSLGVLLYFLLTGAYPQAPTAGTDAPRPTIVWTGAALNVPAALSQLIERMLATNPADRPRMEPALKKELLKAVPKPARPAANQLLAPPVTGPLLTWAQGLRWAASGLLLCGAIGVLSTAEYNAVLGRHGVFRSEAPMVYLQTGLRSLVTPVALTCLLAVVAAAAILAWRLLCLVVPGPTSRLRAACTRITTALEGHGLLTRSTILQAAGVVGLLGLIGVFWVYQSLVAALTTSVDHGPREVFGALNSGLDGVFGSFRASLHLVLLAMLLALVWSRRYPKDASSEISTAGVIGVCTLIAFVMAASYRVMQTPAMREVRYSGETCYVLAEQPREWLLHCPSRRPPRNRVISINDQSMQPTDRTGVPFDAYPLVAGYVPVSNP